MKEIKVVKSLDDLDKLSWNNEVRRGDLISLDGLNVVGYLVKWGKEGGAYDEGRITIARVAPLRLEEHSVSNGKIMSTCKITNLDGMQDALKKKYVKDIAEWEARAK